MSGRHTARTPAFGYLWKKINSRLGVFCASRLSTDTAVSRPFPGGVTIGKEKDVLEGNHWLAVMEWLEKPSVLQSQTGYGKAKSQARVDQVFENSVLKQKRLDCTQKSQWTKMRRGICCRRHWAMHVA